MSKLQQRCTPLLPLIFQVISKNNNKVQLQRIVFDQKISLAIIERSPIICLSDFKNSIQANFSKRQQLLSNPFNKLKNDYYTVIDKSWISLNAAVKYLQEPKQFPCPYEPYFHFKKDYKQYCQQRPIRVYRCQCQMVTIFSWSLKIVNIGQTGYYGIILHVLDSKRHTERFYQNLVNISSVLYEPQVQSKMQSFRLGDIRRHFNVAKDEKVPYSLFYYCKESQTHSKLKKRQNNIIAMDTAKTKLNYDSNQPQKLVSFGLIQGLVNLQFPAKSGEINYQKLKALHSQNIDIFFNSLNYRSEQQKQQKRPILWSSESEGEQDFDSEREKQQKMMNQGSQQRDEDQDSQSSNQDPLRNLYIKNFANIKFQK